MVAKVVVLLGLSSTLALAQPARVGADSWQDARQEAKDAVAQNADGKSAEELFNLVVGKDYKQANAAKDELRKMGPAAAPGVASFLNASDWVVRYRALLFLGELKEPKVADAVAAKLTDPQSEVRAAAIETLLLLGDARGHAPLIAALKEKKPEWPAFRAAGTLHDDESFAALVAVLRDHQDLVPGGFAAKALGARHDARAAEPLAAAARDMRDKYTNVRRDAVEALDELGGPEAAAALGTVVADPRTDQRKHAAEVLLTRATPQAYAAFDAAVAADPAARGLLEPVMRDFDVRGKPRRTSADYEIILMGFKWMKEWSFGEGSFPGPKWRAKRGHVMGVLRFRQRRLAPGEAAADALRPAPNVPLAEVLDANGAKAAYETIRIGEITAGPTPISEPVKRPVFEELPLGFPAGFQPVRCTIRGLEFPLAGLVFGTAK